ncbi:MAG: hypothetical protein ABSE77_22215 [Acidimicrobiales bacterium]|jgi:hypothetical protein
MTHRVFGVFAAILFALFVVAGVVTLVHTLPVRSCAGVSPQNYSSDSVEINPGPSSGGAYWSSIPTNHCVEVISAEAAQANNLTAGNGYDLGPAPSTYTGTTWNYVRLGIGAWIAWTLAMTMLAIAVAAMPKAKPTSAVVVEPLLATDRTVPLDDWGPCLRCGISARACTCRGGPTLSTMKERGTQAPA